MTTRECEHLVAGSYFRPRNKDGRHAIRSAVVENPMLHVTRGVTKLVKIRIRRMRILTFEIRRMRMRMEIEAFILSVGM